MNIRTTQQTLPRTLNSQKPESSREAYKKSLEGFNEIAPAANDRYQSRTSLVTNVSPFIIAPALIGGNAAIWHHGEPILDKILDNVHPVVGVPLALVGTFGPMVAGMYGAWKATEFVQQKLTHNPEFNAVQAEHTKVRDGYRDELLNSFDDEGVTAISESKWTSLENANIDFYRVGGPVGKEVSLNSHVNDLEWLLDMRAQEDWRGDIAREQDDPTVARRMIREAADDPR